MKNLIFNLLTPKVTGSAGGQNSKYSGQTIMEIVIALGIAIIVIVAVVALAIQSLGNINYSRQQGETTRYLTEGMEWVRQQRDLDWNNLVSRVGQTKCLPTLAWSDSSSCDSISGTKLVRKVTIVEKAQDTQNQISEIEVTVQIMWSDQKGTNREAKISSQFSKWGFNYIPVPTDEQQGGGSGQQNNTTPKCAGYRDEDGDTWGADSLVNDNYYDYTPTQVDCVKSGNSWVLPAGYVTKGGDCYDKNLAAKPGNTAWQSAIRGVATASDTAGNSGNSWDYNCNGVEEKQDTNIKVASTYTYCTDSGPSPPRVYNRCNNPPFPVAGCGQLGQSCVDETITCSSVCNNCPSGGSTDITNVNLSAGTTTQGCR